MYVCGVKEFKVEGATVKKKRHKNFHVCGTKFFINDKNIGGQTINFQCFLSV